MLPQLHRTPNPTVRTIGRWIVLVHLVPCAFMGCTSRSADGPNATTATAAAPDKWKPFTSAAGRFTIVMPGTPYEKEQEVPTPGGTLLNHVFRVDLDDDSYGVSYS